MFTLFQIVSCTEPQKIGLAPLFGIPPIIKGDFLYLLKISIVFMILVGFLCLPFENLINIQLALSGSIGIVLGLDHMVLNTILNMAESANKFIFLLGIAILGFIGSYFIMFRSYFMTFSLMYTGGFVLVMSLPINNTPTGYLLFLVAGFASLVCGKLNNKLLEFLSRVATCTFLTVCSINPFFSLIEYSTNIYSNTYVLYKFIGKALVVILVILFIMIKMFLSNKFSSLSSKK